MTYQEVEQARKKYLKRIKKELAITAMLIVVASAILGITSGSGSATIPYIILIAIVVSVFSLIICIIVNSKISTVYAKAYKAYFVEQNLRKVFSDLTYNHETGIPPAVLSATGMINTGDRYSANDYTEGKYKNVAFHQSDVHIETKCTDSDGGTYYATIFRGRFMIFEFPKQFNFKLEIVGRSFYAYKKPGKNAMTGQKAQKIATESNEFNRMFRVFGQDGFEAYYILDPAFMVKIMDIATMHKDRVLFAFFENQLIIGLDDGKDSFEPPSPLKKIDETKESAKATQDIKTITDFVDQLSLDRKLFTNQ